MKKKSKAPIILIFIIILAAAGFGYYKFMWLPENETKYEIVEETSVETKEVGSFYNGGLTETNIYDGIFAIMNNTDASYFTAEFTEDNGGTKYVVNQTNGTSFNEKSVGKLSKVSKKVVDGVDNFLNISYKSFPQGPYDDSDGSTLFGKLYVSSMAEETIDPKFDGSVQDYFEKYELELSCENVKIEKVALLNEYDEYYYYMFQLSADVLTENCNEKTDYFAPIGENKELTVFMLCGYDNNVNDIHADYMAIK